MAGHEHALFVILLLGCLLRDLPGVSPASLYLIASGLLLALLPPLIIVELPWNLLLALVLPWMFWQYARIWLRVERRLPGKEAFLWLITTLSLVLVVGLVGSQPWIKAIFFGIVAASMLWQATSREGISGQLILARFAWCPPGQFCRHLDGRRGCIEPCPNAATACGAPGVGRQLRAG